MIRSLLLAPLALLPMHCSSTPAQLSWAACRADDATVTVTVDVVTNGHTVAVWTETTAPLIAIPEAHVTIRQAETSSRVKIGWRIDDGEFMSRRIKVRGWC